MSVEEAKTSYRYRRQVVPGLIVIAVGVFFLLGNLDISLPFFDYANWWAWFILFAAAWPLYDAMERYRSAGSVDAYVLHRLLNAAAIVLVAMMFILQLNWGQWWPLFVIYGGACMLVRDPRRNVDDNH